MRDILLCGTWRCGSTMVCEDLANSQALGIPNETLCRWDEKDTTQNWKDTLDEVREGASTSNGVFSTKLMAAHMVKINFCLSSFVDPSPAVGALPYLASAFRDPLWVWIERNDVIAQAISSFVAVKTGTYHLITNKRGYLPGKANKNRPDVIPYDFDGILKHWSTLRRHNLMWESFFRTNKISPMRLSYEDAAERPVAPQIAEIAGIQLQNFDSTRNLRKLADERSVEMHDRFSRDLLAK